MAVRTAIGLVLELISTTLVNFAYLREHDAAAELPALSLRRPLHSLGLLLSDRSWLAGFALETGGFAFYVAALSLASLSLVQSVGAGGIGVLAYISARLGNRGLRVRERRGAAISVVGLLALAASISTNPSSKSGGAIAGILLWLGVTAGVAAIVVVFAGRWMGRAVAYGVAGGLLFSIGDIATKVATGGGVRLLFAVPLILGYTLGTTLLQIGYQGGAALTVAGIATLLTNALPIAAGTSVLDEPVPGGALGALRVFAFAAVTAGAILLARPDPASTPATGPSRTG